MYAIQRRLGVPRAISGARILSRIGEHALGWLTVGGIGIATSRGHQRRAWVRATQSVVAAHATAVVVKRVVRRQRPDDPRIQVLVSTPSRLSFPSAHVMSTTAAAVGYGSLMDVGRLAPASVAAAMAASRLILGVHFPSDVAVGVLAGWAVAASMPRGLT